MHSSHTMAVLQTTTQLALLFLLVLHGFSFAVIKPGRIESFGPQDLENLVGPPEMNFWPHYFADGYLGERMNELKHEKRYLSGTQDWGKRSSASRPLRMGKRKYYFNMWSPISNKELNLMITLSMFG